MLTSRTKLFRDHFDKLRDFFDTEYDVRLKAQVAIRLLPILRGRNDLRRQISVLQNQAITIKRRIAASG